MLTPARRKAAITIPSARPMNGIVGRPCSAVVLVMIGAPTTTLRPLGRRV